MWQILDSSHCEVTRGWRFLPMNGSSLPSLCRSVLASPWGCSSDISSQLFMKESEVWCLIPWALLAALGQNSFHSAPRLCSWLGDVLGAEMLTHCAGGIPIFGHLEESRASGRSQDPSPSFICILSLFSWFFWSAQGAPWQPHHLHQGADGITSLHLSPSIL